MDETSLAESRRRWAESFSELPPSAHQLSAGDPVITSVFEGF